MSSHFHVFVGSFKSRDEACAYTEAQFEPEPGEDASDEEYSAWEDKEPAWQMRSDLGLDYLSSDFIETIDEAELFEYLAGMLTEPGAIGRIRELAGAEDNILVLIFHEALGGFPGEMKSTPRLKYCGQFASNL